MDHLGRYRIDGVIGEGSLGRVYRAHDEAHARPVALKVLHRADDDRAVLLDQARAGASLDHPNIVPVYEVSEIDGAVAIAMALVDGRPLRSFIGDPAVAPGVRVGWLLDVARALAAGHARGVLHRSVRPENILVRPDDSVVLLEFGVARRTRSTAATALAAQFDATAPGSSLDVPLFLSPEQIRNQPIDARADQFAWAVLAYELLAGVHPWAPARDPIAIIAAILGRPARPLRDVVPAAPELFARAVDRALLKEPKARFPAMTDLIAAATPAGPSHARMLLALQSSQVRAAGSEDPIPGPLAAASLARAIDPRIAAAQPAPRPPARWPWVVVLVTLAVMIGAVLALSQATD